MNDHGEQVTLIGPMGHVSVPKTKAADYLASGKYKSVAEYAVKEKPKARAKPKSEDPPPLRLVKSED